MSDVVLSAGVRQNLLSLQNTAQLMSITQNRLATGKKVNSALDNPANFFTSQALSDRATDLNALLDSIGQATQTIDAANNGITSLTKLVQSAKSIAQQARQSTSATTNSYSAVNVSGAVVGTETLGSVQGADLSPKPIALSFTNQAETLGQLTGTGGGAFPSAGTVGAGNNGNLVLHISNDGSGTFHDVTIAVATTDTITNVINNINAAVDAGGSDPNEAGTIHATNQAGQIRLTALGSNVDFSINTGTSTANTLTATGLTTTSGTGASTSLLDNIIAAGGTLGDTLALTVNGGVPNVITFDRSHVQTLAQLNTFIANNGGLVTGSAAGTNISLNLAAATGNTLGLTASSAGVKAALGLNTATTAVNLTNGTNRGGLGTAVNALSRTYNSDVTLAEIDPTNLASGGNFTVSIDQNDGNGFQPQVIGLSGSDNLATVASKLLANATIANNVNVSTVGGKLKLTAKTSDVDFTVKGSFAGTALGTNTNSSTDNTGGASTSLLDNLITAGGAAGQQLTVQGNGGVVQTITFGTGTNQVSTLAEFGAAVTNLSGVTGTLTGSALNIGEPAGTAQTTVTIGGDPAVVAQLGLTAGTTNGTFTAGTPDSTRASLQSDFNNVLSQIDSLAKDSSYNGINLLFGDDLKVVFNEQNTSTLTIPGVTLDSGGLGLATINGTGFQSNATIDTTLASIDTALTTLRTQASKFGANLTTVEVRQDFTKSMVNTLQVGSDALVLADSNEEGANMLALQTRQQLSTTALSLANQASQAVLRLFS